MYQDKKKKKDWNSCLSSWHSCVCGVLEAAPFSIRFLHSGTDRQLYWSIEEQFICSLPTPYYTFKSQKQGHRVNYLLSMLDNWLCLHHTRAESQTLHLSTCPQCPHPCRVTLHFGLSLFCPKSVRFGFLKVLLRSIMDEEFCIPHTLIGFVNKLQGA